MRLGVLAVGAGIMVWAAGVAGGYVALARHTTQAGTAAEAPARWPDGAPLELARERATLLLFVHPHCPCSRATVEELDRLLARDGDGLRTCAFVYADPALGEAWSRTGLREALEALPDVEVRDDPGGAVARAFGVRTSGQALLYGPDGGLRFAGGITRGRGHSGDNAGWQALQRQVLHAEGADSAPVYGCSLCGPGEASP